jgi:hypothetical protein
MAIEVIGTNRRIALPATLTTSDIDPDASRATNMGAPATQRLT